MTEQVKPSTLPPSQVKPVAPTATKSVDPVAHPIQAKPTLSTTILPPPPKEVVPMAIPDGSLDINLVRPGFGPLEGSPKENDPTVLFNPNNPLSPITKPLNPSNPANPPQTQSEKPASEVRMFNDLNPPVVLEANAKAVEERKAKVADSFKKISGFLEEFGNESSIPANSEYWSLLAQHRALMNP